MVHITIDIEVGVMNSYWFVGNLMSWSSKCCVLVVYLSPFHGSNQSVLDICGDKVLKLCSNVLILYRLVIF